MSTWQYICGRHHHHDHPHAQHPTGSRSSPTDGNMPSSPRPAVKPPLAVLMELDSGSAPSWRRSRCSRRTTMATGGVARRAAAVPSAPSSLGARDPGAAASTPSSLAAAPPWGARVAVAPAGGLLRGQRDLRREPQGAQIHHPRPRARLADRAGRQRALADCAAGAYRRAHQRRPPGLPDGPGGGRAQRLAA